MKSIAPEPVPAFGGKKSWGELPLPGAACEPLRIGQLNLWFKVLEGDLWHSWKHAQDGDPDSQTPAEDASWSRWALQEDKRRLRLLPVYPDRPVVVKTESPIMLSPRDSVQIYIRCPLWVRVELLNHSPVTVTEIPTVVLSNTWFGTTLEGDLCYWVSSGARREAQADPDRPFLAVCPILVRNRSEDDLKIEKVCLHVEWLSLFEKDGQLWSDLTRVTYHGKKRASEVEVNGKPSGRAAGARLVSLPRHPSKRELSVRTFAALKEIADFLHD